MSRTTHLVFLGVTPGLEPYLAEEVRGLVGVEPKVLDGGVELRVSREALWTLASFVRQAESLRLRLGQFRAHDFDQLARGLAKLSWAAFLDREATPVVKASCHKSALYHSDAVSERAVAAICSRLRGTAASPSLEGAPPRPAPTVYLRLVDDVAEVSLDVGTERLHRRGWREYVSSAPIRESLAASLLAVAGWEAGTALWDPFCGAGTIPLEAADQLRAGPARSGPFGFESWPTHDGSAYAEWLRDNAAAHGKPGTSGTRIGGSDRSEKAIAAATHNRRIARLDGRVPFEISEIADAAPLISDDAMIVSNLPYGKRINAGVAVGCLKTLTRLQRERAGAAVVLTAAKWASPAEENGWHSLLRFKNRGYPVVVLRWKQNGGRPR